jgi:hypothetical protein
MHNLDKGAARDKAQVTAKDKNRVTVKPRDTGMAREEHGVVKAKAGWLSTFNWTYLMSRRKS